MPVTILDAFTFSIRWLIAPPFAIQNFELPGEATGDGVNVHTYACDGEVDLEAAGVILADHFAEVYPPAMGPSSQLWSYRLEGLPGDFAPHDEVDGMFGTLPLTDEDFEPLPNQCCVVFQKRAPIPGPAGRGRTFLSPVTTRVFVLPITGYETSLDEVDQECPELEAVRAAIAAPVVVGSVTCYPALYSRTAQTCTLIGDVIIQKVMGSLRRRRTRLRSPG